MFQAKALYDFVSEIDEELSFNIDDILSILSTDVGNGWWEARNKSGCVGLVPQLYLQKLSNTNLQNSNCSPNIEKRKNLLKPKIPEKPVNLKSQISKLALTNNNFEENLTEKLSLQNFLHLNFKNRPLPEIPTKAMLNKVGPINCKSKPIPPKKPDWLIINSNTSISHYLNNRKSQSPRIHIKPNKVYESNSHLNEIEGVKNERNKFSYTLPCRFTRNANSSPLFSLKAILIKQISLDCEKLNSDLEETSRKTDTFMKNEDTEENQYRNASELQAIDGDIVDEDFDDYDDEEYDEDAEEYLSSFKDANLSQNSHSNNHRMLGFNKGSSDSYLFDMNLPPLPENLPKHQIIIKNEIPMWQAINPEIQCYLKSPTKATKFKGMKSFILYEIVLMSTGKSVFRRFKHFDWLYQRLVEKYSTIPIPSLPDKQIAGRFDEGFIHRRQHRLQKWLNRITNHPVISQSLLLHHFVSCSDQEMWKTGKRLHEKDKYQGAMFFRTIEKPDAHLDLVVSEEHLDNFGRFINCFEDSICHLLEVSESISQKYKESFYKDFNSIGICAENLAKSFELHSKFGLTNSLFNFGKIYRDLAVKFYEQPQNDISHIVECLHEYRGIVSAFPEILLVHRSSTNGIQENSGQMHDDELSIVQDRADVITWSILVEIERFQAQQLVDFHQCFVAFLQRQIHFFHLVTSQLEQCLNQFETT